jgi:hypothetical protein
MALKHHVNLTGGQDTAISGHQFNFNGGNNIANGGVTVTGSIVSSGPFFDQPSLSTGDHIELFGANNVLNASYNPGLLGLLVPQIISGVTIEGVQTADFNNFGFGSVVVLTGNIGGVSPHATKNGLKVGGLNTVTYDNSLGAMDLGADIVLGGNGLNNVVTTLNVLNDGGAGNIVSGSIPYFAMFIAESAFLAAGASTAITIATSNLTNGAGSLFSPIIPPDTPFAHVGLYGILAGPNNVEGAVATNLTGYKTFTLSNLGSTNENIALSSAGATNATQLTLTSTNGATSGTGGIALYGDNGNFGVAEWNNLTSINGTALNGQTYITGDEIGTFGFLAGVTGVLGQKLSITLGNFAGTKDAPGSGNFVDLADWTATAANLSVNTGGGAGGEVDFSNALLTAGVALAGFNAQILGDGSFDVGGTIDFALLFVNSTAPDMLQLGPLAFDRMGDASVDITGNLIVKNVPANFTLSFQSADFTGVAGHQNVEVDSTNTSSTSQLNLTFADISNSDGSFIATGFNKVSVTATDGTHEFFGTSFLVQSNVGQPAPELDLHTANGGTRIGQDSITDPTGVGVSTVTLVGGNLLKPIVGTIVIDGNDSVYLGVTDASSITDSGTGRVEMLGPADPFAVGGTSTGIHGVTVSVAGSGSILQGSMGPLVKDAQAINYTGVTGTDTITSAGGSSAIYGDGGPDTIHLGGSGNNTVFFGTFLTGAGNLHGQTITDNTDNAYDGFWGNGGTGGLTFAKTGTAITGNNDVGTQIDGFVIGGGAVTHDNIEINEYAWAGSSANTAGHLVQSDFTPVADGPATGVAVSAGGTVASGADIVLYTFGTAGIASASALAADLEGVGAITMAGNIVAHTHVLFAFDLAGGGVEIADVDFNTTAGNKSTSGLTIYASDLVDLHGVNVSLAGLGANIGDIHFTHHAG